MNVLDHSTKDSAKDYLGKVCLFSNNVSSFTNPVSKCQLGVLDGLTRGIIVSVLRTPTQFGSSVCL